MSSTAPQLDRALNVITGSESDKTTPVAHCVKWEPDPDLLSSGNSSILNQDCTSSGPASSLLEQRALHCIHKAVNAFDHAQIAPRNQDIWKFFVAIARSQAAPTAPPNIGQIIESGPTGQLLVAIGEGLPSTLRGQLDITTLLQTSDLLQGHLQKCYNSISDYLSLLMHKNPAISILQLGAGGGKASQTFLEGLGDTNFSRGLSYTVADSDRVVLKDAAKILSRWEEMVDYKSLRIGADLEPQGFTPHQYDVIIVPYGIYTTTPEQALRNIRLLLKQNGRLILVNPTDRPDNLVESVIFGCLPGWPGVTRDALQEAQLSVDSLFESNNGSVILSHPLQEQPSSAEVLIIDDGDCGVSTFQLRNALSELQLKTEVTYLAYAKPAGRLCIVLSDLVSPVLARINSKTLEAIKAIFLESSGVLWVTRGGTIKPTNPDAALILGLARTARIQSAVDPIVTLDLDGQDVLPDKQAAEVIFDLLKRRFFSPSLQQDNEYAERNSILHIPRIVDNTPLSHHLATVQDPLQLSEQPFHDRPVRAINSGEDVYFIDDHRASELPPDHVSIKVQAIGLTRHDANVPAQSFFGSQCSGTIYAVGDSVQDFSPGDQVVCLGSGTTASVYHDRAEAFQKIPTESSLDFAASLPVAFCTAFFVFHHLARIGRNDAVLIHGAANSYGQALVELCGLKRVRLFATVSDDAQKGMLSRFNIPSDRILIANDGNFVQDLLEITQKGVDVIVNCGSDSDIDHLTSCITSYGRFIQLGDLRTPKLLKDVIFASFSLEKLRQERPDALHDGFRQVMDLFRDGILRGPCHLEKYNISGIVQALNANSNTPVIVTAGPNDLVQVTKPNLFRPDASYMLVGGLGGLGRAIAIWMADRGAQTLIFISRSGQSKASSREIVQTLQERGVRVIVYACDIADAKQVQNIISELAQVAPPIRGVIQATMVMRTDSIEALTPETYHPVLAPKYHGTHNLHATLASQPLDFFLLLSSISGLFGPAVYAVGSTFMDAFAAYRHTQNLPAVSLDLGPISNAGFLADRPDIAAGIKESGFQWMDTRELLGLIEWVIERPDLAGPQVVTGLGSG